MTVAELKNKLKGVPDNMDVFITQTNDEFEISMLETANIKEASFEDSEEETGLEKVFLLSDEI